MNRPSFNVLEEPWIPVVRPDGSREELGILPCLEQAHRLQEIRDPSPIIEFGLYRLLVALILDALIQADERPEDPLDLKELIDGEEFDRDVLKAYVDQCGDVFDLFHPERPFLQTVVEKGKAKPLAAMYPAVASGTNVSHWDHQGEDQVSVTAQEAARLLATVAPFMTAGGAGLSPSINGAPAIYALPVGASLFETTVMNLPLRDQDSGGGTVAWRSSRQPGEDRVQATTVEALTWRPRRIQFLPIATDTGGIEVAQMLFEKGDSTRLDWLDASLSYRYGKDKPTSVKMREGRPLWRDAGPLVLLDEYIHGEDEKKIAFRRPEVIGNAFEIADADRPLGVQIYGMRTDLKMKVFEWAKSCLAVPVGLGRSTRLGSVVDHEFQLAEKAAFALRTNTKALYPREGKGNKDALGRLVDRSERGFWLLLEGHLYPLMNGFAALGEDAAEDADLIAATAGPWREAVTRLAVQKFEEAAKDMDADSDALMRQVQARSRLKATLRKVLS